MKLRSGIPLIADLSALQADPLYQTHVDFNKAFLENHGKALAGYGNHWGQNPFTMWSRRWEYPYVIQKVLDYAATRDPNDALRMLDGGSGVTYVPYFLTEKLPNLSVICCDTDTSYVPMFDAINANTAHKRVRFQEAMLQKLPFDDKTLDVVACISVLEHTDNYGQIVTEFARVLKPGGQLVVTFDLSLDGKFTLSRTTAAELLGTIEKHFDISNLSALPELARMEKTEPLLTTDYVKKTNPELLPWRYPLLKGVHDLVKGHGWTGGFRSKAVYCLDALRKA